MSEKNEENENQKNFENTKKKRNWFSKKRKWQENYDEFGNYIPRKKNRNETYTDYYGPIIEGEKGNKAGKFFFKEYENLGHLHYFGDILILILFVVFIGYGIYNLYYIGGVIRDSYIYYEVDLSQYNQLIWFFVYIILILVIFWIISLAIGYLFVRLFAEIAGYLMYILVIAEIGFLTYTYLTVEWDYKWLLLILVIPNIFMFTIWYKKFKIAIYTLRMSSLAVAKQREILVPQITQTMWLVILSFFQFITMLGTFYNVTPAAGGTINIGDKTYDPSEGWILFAYSCIFVFLIFVIYFVSQGMKMLMIHNWYRGGGSMGFWHAFHVIRHRWWGIISYAFYSTIIHTIQFFSKMIKGEYGMKDIKDCFTKTGELIPTQANALKVKPNTPWYEKFWISLNFYTLPAIIIENKLYYQALWRSIYLSLRDIPSRYIKESKVNLLFGYIRYALVAINGLIGAYIGNSLGKWFGLEGHTLNLFTAAAVPVFMWVAGGTANVIVNDLNNSYITILYVHTLDELNDKKNYTINELGKIKGETHIISTDKKE